MDNLRHENRHSTALDSEQRFAREVFDTELAEVRLVDLSANDVRSWRNSMHNRLSPASVNRTLNALKAALNYGFRHGMCLSDHPWKVVERLTVNEKRELEYLCVEDRRKLLEHCPDDLSLFLKALMYTAARPGEIANCQTKDFDPQTGALILRSNKGKRKDAMVRKFTLSGEGYDFFVQQHRLKLPRAFLFSTSEGRQWVKWLWSRPLRVAVQRSELPQGTTAYTIRHSVITDWLINGIDIGTVARLTGTSIQMINDYYFKALPDRAADQIAAIAVV